MQKILGFRKYLYVFAIFKIKTLHNDKNEKDFFHFLSLLKDKNGDILDIGANIGIMTYHLSVSFPSTKVHSFEPMPDNLEVLRKIVSKYKLSNVEIHPVALGETNGTLKMILPHNGKTKMQGLSHVKHDSIKEWNEGDEFEVDSKTLDGIFSSTAIQGIKIDVENFEYFAFKGGIEVITRNKPIIYAELWDNENRVKCFELLSALGYKTYVVCQNSLVEYNSDQHQAQNFIFRAN